VLDDRPQHRYAEFRGRRSNGGLRDSAFVIGGQHERMFALTADGLG
jgi:hypothetical protein